MFDDALLDEEAALARADATLRELAEAGARVRVDARSATEHQGAAPQDLSPRAVVAVGAEARLLRAVLEPVSPVPFVAWDRPSLPAWASSLDLVVVTSSGDAASRAAVAEAQRRGCMLLVAAAPHSALAEDAAGRWTTLLPVVTADPLAACVAVLQALHAAGLAPSTDAEGVAGCLDAVAIACSPFRDLGSNRAKQVADAVGDAQPLLWGGSVLAARAARRWAEGLRRVAGLPTFAGPATDLVPLLESAGPRDVFADPVDGEASARPRLVVLDDGSDDPRVRAERGGLAGAAERHDVGVDTVAAHDGDALGRYAALVATGGFVAAYVAVGLGL
ncbi:phosphoglucose isomerase-like protein [Mumia flava]|uniref:Phosphoglucose isomerase-like protein n=1 Tax=Mumia flava TaxID=1348852 RepID=A0A0B2BI73_9ACTN|nr:SIS domain-containing protein [Mumia flava]PJJ58537.1 phosphoglucose isomerase-like protein [Mumia flava]